MQPPAISLASPAALVASLPFLVGFPPEESLVLLWMRRGTLRLSGRACGNGRCDAGKRRPSQESAAVWAALGFICHWSLPF